MRRGVMIGLVLGVCLWALSADAGCPLAHQSKLVSPERAVKSGRPTGPRLPRFRAATFRPVRDWTFAGSRVGPSSQARAIKTAHAAVALSVAL